MIVNDTNRALVLASLYNAARPQGLGYLHYDPRPMTEEEADLLLTGSGGYFEYLKGRALRVSVGRPGSVIFAMDFALYDRYNGPGAGARACKGLEV